METIKVNMNPNPLDVQTIHASQNDGEARQWEFKLHNNGDAIDSSEVTDQMVFKAYKGGTEQLLPENTSTPVTSPFKGDIRYPQGLLTDQEFTYRQSPTENDGLAFVENIKGNTINWNQLVQNGNFADTSNWYARDGATLTVSDNVGTLVTTSASISAIVSRFSYVQNHKYLIKLSAKSSNGQILGVGFTNNNGSIGYPRMNITASSSWQDYYIIGTANNAPSGNVVSDGLVIRNNNATAQTVELKNVQVFDLTQMGLDTLTDAEVKQWFAENFPLPYYDYNQGTLLSFNGNGIKTVGFNQWDEEWENGGISVTTGGSEVRNTSIRSKNFIPIFPNSTYYFKLPSATYPFFYDENYNYIGFHGSGNTILNKTFVPSALTNSASGGGSFANAKYMKFRCDNGGTYEDNICLNFSSDRNGTYEPYTSSTLSLPISTYFPAGMKSAGNVYDELTETGYVERTAYIKFDGSQPWATRTTSGGFVLYEYVPSNIKNVGTQATAQILNNRYPWNTNLAENKTIRQVNTTITVRRDDITSLQAWYSELASNPLEIVYQLATPTETSFTTASLVTENAEIPLSNEDGTLIGKCTEELSENPGFIDAKIKLSDSDGTCYSNKIQLHVERSPQ